MKKWIKDKIKVKQNQKIFFATILWIVITALISPILLRVYAYGGATNPTAHTYTNCGQSHTSVKYTTTTKSQAIANMTNAAQHFAGWHPECFSKAYGVGPTGPWCAWYIKKLAEAAGVADVFSTKAEDSDNVMKMFLVMTNPAGKYKGQGYVVTDTNKNYESEYYNSEYIWKYAQTVTTSTFTPQVGDLIFIQNSTSTSGISHVGYVCAVDASYVYFTDGNGGDSVDNPETGNSNVQWKYRFVRYTHRYSRNSTYICAYIRPKYEISAAITDPGIDTPTITLPAAMTSNNSAEAKTNILTYAKSLVGYNRSTFNSAGRTDIPAGDWCTWYLKLCGERVGVNSLFSAQTNVSGFCSDMIKNYGAQGYYYTDSPFITSGDIAALSGAQAVTKASFTPQPGDIYILDEYGKGISQVGFVENVVSGSVYALVGNNGTAQEVQYRNSTTNYFYQISNSKCPIIGYIRPNYASLDQTAPPAHVHSTTYVAAKAATCEAAGNQAYYVCSSCGGWYWDSACTKQISSSNAVVMAPKGHKYSGNPAYADGTNHFYACANGCGTKKLERHQGNRVNGKDATCTEDGWKTYYICACGVWYWDSACTQYISDKNAVVIPAKGHDFSGKASYVDATQHVYTCANGCGTKKTEAHDGQEVSAKAATCTEAGNRAYYICACGGWYWDKACTDYISDGNAVVLPALGHNFSGSASYVDQKQHVYICANGCGTKKTEAHSLTLVKGQAATCAVPGSKDYYSCTCGAKFLDSACENRILSEQEIVIPAQGHRFDDKLQYIDHLQHARICLNGCGEKQAEAHKDADGDKVCDLCGGETIAPGQKGLHVTLKDAGANYVYTGSAITPEIIVINNGDVLVPGVDYTVTYSNNINVSTGKTEKSMPRITVKGKNNLIGSSSMTFNILPKNIGEDDVVADNLLIVEGTKAVPVLTYRGLKLTAKDYTVKDAQKTFTKDGLLVINGQGNFKGSKSIPVKVVSKNAIKKFTVTLGTEKLVYNGKEQKQSVTVRDASTKENLKENKDYKVVYHGNLTDAGTVKFSVVGMGEYIGTVTKSYTIKPLAAKQGMKVTGVNPKGYAYSAKGVRIGGDLKVSYSSATGSMVLQEGRDYKISYSNNTKVSTAKSPAKYTISFIGNYQGSTALKGTFSIYTASIGKETPGLKVVVPDKVYTGKPGTYKSDPYITIAKTALKKTDYSVAYYKDAAMKQEIVGRENNITLSSKDTYATIYVKIILKGNYKSSNGAEGYVTASYKVHNKQRYKDLSGARVTFLDDNGKALTKLEYTGRALTPKVKVEVKEGKDYVEVPANQYEVVYINNVDRGTGIAIIRGTGNSYGGCKLATFKIVSRNVGYLKDFWKGIAIK